MVYKISEIEKKLRISKATSYRYIKQVYNEQEPFKVILVGESLRIVKASFDNWLNHDVYEVKDIQKILKLSRAGAYGFIHDVYQKQEPFRVLKILTQYRIPKDSFSLWIGETSTICKDGNYF